MEKINQQVNLSLNYPEKLYKMIYSIKLDRKVSVNFLLNIWMKREMDLSSKCEDKIKIVFLQYNKLKNQPRTWNLKKCLIRFM